MVNNEEQYKIQSVSRAFGVLDLICKTNNEITLSDVCNELTINANMAYRLLMTMVNEGYLDKDDSTGKFRITLKVLQLGRIAINSLEIRKWAMPFIEDLWRKFPQANVNLGVLEKGEVIAIARIESNKVPKTHFSIGRVLPPHATALGKLLLSEISESELIKIINKQGLKKYTNRTIDTVDQLKNELIKVREEKMAWDKGEHIPNDNCIAAPIRNSNRKVIGALSMSAFEIHMNIKDLEKAILPLRETANNISHAMGYMN